MNCLRHFLSDKKLVFFCYTAIFYERSIICLISIFDLCIYLITDRHLYDLFIRLMKGHDNYVKQYSSLQTFLSTNLYIYLVK